MSWFDSSSEYAQALISAAATAPRVVVTDTCRLCGDEWKGVRFVCFARPRPDDHRSGDYGYKTNCCGRWAGDSRNGYGRTNEGERQRAVKYAKRREIQGGG